MTKSKSRKAAGKQQGSTLACPWLKDSIIICAKTMTKTPAVPGWRDSQEPCPCHLNCEPRVAERMTLSGLEAWTWPPVSLCCPSLDGGYRHSGGNQGFGLSLMNLWPSGFQVLCFGPRCSLCLSGQLGHFPLLPPSLYPLLRDAKSPTGCLLTELSNCRPEPSLSGKLPGQINVA